MSVRAMILERFERHVFTKRRFAFAQKQPAQHVVRFTQLQECFPCERDDVRCWNRASAGPDSWSGRYGDLNRFESDAECVWIHVRYRSLSTQQLELLEKMQRDTTTGQLTLEINM